MKPPPTTHCKRGHELAGDNLYVRPSGARCCRTCKRIAHNEKAAERNYTTGKMVGTIRTVETTASRPSDDLIAEAQQRAMAPRSLSAMLLGDPPVGFSMLDRRGAI